MIPRILPGEHEVPGDSEAELLMWQRGEEACFITLIKRGHC